MSSKASAAARMAIVPGSGTGEVSCQKPVILHRVKKHPPRMLSEPTQYPAGTVLGNRLLMAISLSTVSKEMLAARFPGVSSQVMWNSQGPAGPLTMVPSKAREMLPPPMKSKVSPVYVGAAPYPPTLLTPNWSDPAASTSPAGRGR